MTVVNVSKQMRERTYHPCDDCQVGWGSIGTWRDPESGDLMQETKSCHDDCLKLKLYTIEHSHLEEVVYGFMDTDETLSEGVKHIWLDGVEREVCVRCGEVLVDGVMHICRDLYGDDFAIPLAKWSNLWG